MYGSQRNLTKVKWSTPRSTISYMSTSPQSINFLLNSSVFQQQILHYRRKLNKVFPEFHLHYSNNLARLLGSQSIDYFYRRLRGSWSDNFYTGVYNWHEYSLCASIIGRLKYKRIVRIQSEPLQFKMHSNPRQRGEEQNRKKMIKCLLSYGN